MLAAGRMVRLDVERVKVMVRVLNLGALLDGEAEAAEYLADAVDYPGDRVECALPAEPSGKRHIDGLAGELSVELLVLESLAPCIESIENLLLGTVDLCSGLALLLRRKLSERFHLFGEKALFSQILYPDCIKSSLIDRPADFINSLSSCLLQLFHLMFSLN